jgi:hypothetical protein
MLDHACLSVSTSPVQPPAFLRALPAGTRICDVVPVDTPGAMVNVDGAWILREQWAYPLQPGQAMALHFLPAGNDARKALRLVLTIAATVSFGPAGLGAGEFGITATMSAVLTAGATLAINALLPFRAPQAGGGATAGSPAYDTALGGNRASLNQPIAVLYGRARHMPPFGADPYQEYDNTSGDQFYHALLCLGMGHYTIEALQIDDTEIDAFSEVEYNVLAPGVAPSLVLANVVTAVEVADFPCNPGRSSPIITACRGGLEATHVGFDIVFPGGLGDATGASVTNKSVDIRFDVRPVDDYGVPLGLFTTLATETITAASTEPVRRSFKYALASSMRPQVRVVRTTPRDDDVLVRNDGFWTGLRAYLDVAAPLAAGATHIEIKMRATEQLNGLSQRRVAVIARRMLHTWDSTTGWSASRVFTRNPAWAIADKLRDTTYGNALPNERIDLMTLEDLAATWEDRQDHLDIVIDTLMDSDEADQLMARAGRARAVWRNGVRTFVRDEAQTLEAAAYTGRDIVPGSVSLTYTTDTARIPDGIIVEYFAHRSWEWESITCPAPGVTTPARPEYLRLLGVSGAKQAEREGLYEAAARALRRKFTSITTELQGLLPSYGSLVRLGLPLRGAGQHGDVVSYDSGTLDIVLTEPLVWTAAVDHYITLVRPDGSVHDAILATPGADAYTAVLDSAPDFTPITDDARRERTRFIFGNATEHRRTGLVLGIRPQEMRPDGAVLVEISTVNDDDAIHTADNALLPGEGETQDPIDSPNTAPGSGGEDVYIPYLTPRTVSDSAPAGGDAAGVTLSFLTDGSMEAFLDFPNTTAAIAGQWLLGHPYATTVTELWEIRATLILGTVTGTTGSWLAMTSQRDWSVAAAGDGDEQTATMDFELRLIGDTLIQAKARITITAMKAEFGE